MARVLVTGGNGFIGGHLVGSLLERGDEVTVYDGAPPAGGETAAGARFVEGDVRDADRLGAAMRGVELVYHLAAVVGVDRYLSRPLDVIDINFSGTRTVLDLACRTDARVVVASTSEVFGKNPAVPWAEDGDRVLGPTSANRWTYSSSKALAEHMTFAFAAQHGLEATVVRYFNVYGPGQRPAYIVSRSVHRALNGLPPVVYDRGGQTRCFTYIEDAVAGTVLAGTMPGAAGEAFNLGSESESTVGEVVDLVVELTGVATGTAAADTAAAYGRAYEDLARRVPLTTKARTVLGWKCETPLREGLERTIAWARATPWWLELPDSGAG
ncbi:NAD-dependent epimerase/dehydratase family protein [Streptomyces sp. RerS4]|uniref:NAD-dependent epimerase/dehydratase family protein n=1 Tax=Streptomyces sp. RerS4 TaxID=2942449 RepID=UPI00201BC5B9|nr:NAD-dependent epimerase/dehydratase family protein [Streptomyces sp. RerS4]UQX05371.1 NAD-dependent epimerase/dehydratase family protein [Streptomyces sp. RerS4]